MNRPHNENPYLLEGVSLSKHFTKKGVFGKTQVIKAVDDITLQIKKGETFGLVGESGCGKTTLGRTMIRMYTPTSGKILYQGEDITTLEGKALNHIRSKMQIIFQDPYSSLNPYRTVEEIVREPIDVERRLSKLDAREKVRSILEKVGLKEEFLNRFPHEFSGGQRQRIGIARALSTDPTFILCDEPISALDVSIQAQVVNTLKDLQEDLGLTYLFVAHDLSMVHHISDRVGVMYLGKIIEIAESAPLYKEPLHPYTKALLRSIPIANPKKSRETERIRLEGEIPSAIDIPKGCRFHTRCAYRMPVCLEEEPAFEEKSTGRWVACHLY